MWPVHTSELSLAGFVQHGSIVILVTVVIVILILIAVVLVFVIVQAVYGGNSFMARPLVVGLAAAAAFGAWSPS